MNETIFSVNGVLVPAAQAVVPITDRGFLYGDGLFETLHAYGSRVFCLSAHLRRLADGAQRLHFSATPTAKMLERWIQAAVAHAAFPEANVRLTLTRGSGSRGPSIPGLIQPTVAIMVNNFKRTSEQTVLKGATAVVASFRRQEAAILTGLKTLNYLEQILAKHEADAAGADEAILLNNAGLLCEGSASNISVIRDGRLLIPDPARAGALAGIAQMTAIAAAQKLKIPVLRTALSPWDLTRADEAFLSGTMREITPLVRVGQSQIGAGTAGPLTLKLISAYRKIIERECAPFKFECL